MHLSYKQPSPCKFLLKLSIYYRILEEPIFLQVIYLSIMKAIIEYAIKILTILKPHIK